MHEETFLQTKTQATEHTDFASQLSISREFLGTCARRAAVNNCVSILGYKPYEEVVERRKWGRRAASTATVRKQHVDCFFAFSAPGYKPDARYYNTVQIDIDSFLRTGAVLHGEWFLEKQRVAGGDHRAALPEGMTERSATPPDFAEMEQILSVVDGCRSQFMCGTEHHQVATWRMKTGVTRRQHTLVEKHGKNICDGASNIPRHILESMIKNGATMLPGAREAVVFMAQSHPIPTVAKDKKDDWWAFNRIFYGYFDHDHFTNATVPEAVGFNGSSRCHDFIGLSTDTGLVNSGAPLLARGEFCYCAHCRENDYFNCEYSVAHGPMRRQTTSVARMTESIVRTQLQSLEEWAQQIGDEKLVAVRVDRAAVMASANHTEADDAFWLAKPTGAAFSAPEKLAHTSDVFEEGWLVVPIKWYRIASGTARTYTMLATPQLLVVATTVRVSGLKFSRTKGGKFTLAADDHQKIINNI